LGIGAVAMLIIALWWSSVLNTPTYFWMRLGLLMARVFNPVVLLIFYLCLICPFALLGRILRRDILMLRRSTDSLWIDKGDDGRPQNSLKNIF